MVFKKRASSVGLSFTIKRELLEMLRKANFHRAGMSLALFAVVALGSAVDAKADAVVLQINQTGGTLPAQNYGTVTLTLVGSNIQVTVNLINGNKLIQTGQDASIACNSSLNPGPTITGTGLLGTGYSLLNAGAPGSLHMDGTGTFEYGIGSIFGANDA